MCICVCVRERMKREGCRKKETDRLRESKS